MFNNSKGLEAIETSVFTRNDLLEVGEKLNDFDTIAIVDIANKRKKKYSVPTLILNKIEAKGPISIKKIENDLSRSSRVKDEAAKAAKISKIKGNKVKTVREFVRGRILAVKRYYTAANVISEIFEGFPPLKVDSDGKLSLNYRLFPKAKK